MAVVSWGPEGSTRIAALPSAVHMGSAEVVLCLPASAGAAHAADTVLRHFHKAIRDVLRNVVSSCLVGSHCC
jgi:hypothetical protein